MVNTTKYLTYKYPSLAHAMQNSKHVNTYYSNAKSMKSTCTYIIDKGTPDHKLATIHSTKLGIDTLAKFVRGSKVFQKQTAQAIP